MLSILCLYNRSPHLCLPFIKVYQKWFGNVYYRWFTLMQREGFYVFFLRCCCRIELY
ncbi:hypothetical protein RSAG8_12336, partial [Rhizoctonia solani AG-8 WAC10335]